MYIIKMEELEVEVCCENGAYYKAFVTDVFDNGVSVVFENNWKPESRVPFSQVYLPQREVASSAECTENQEVEVFTKLNENEMCGWWTALIKMTSEKFYLVKYEREETKTEIVASQLLRPKSNNPPIDQNTFHKFEIKVPEYLTEHAEVNDVHEEFRKCINAQICRYSPDLGVLIVISRNEQSRQLSEMIQKMHFHNLREKASLLKRIEAQHKSITLYQGTTKIIEQSEKLLLEKERILSFTECPVCSDYMTAHIFQCNVGHSICSECKNKLVKCPSCNSNLNSTRNFILEKIIENISFPCSNAKFGCEDMILLNERSKHSKCCEYRMYDCLPCKRGGCTWQGRRQDILNHMEQEHKEVTWEGESIDIYDPAFDSNNIWSYDLISAHGEMFWLQRHMDTKGKIYYVSVHYIGPKENCEKYVYMLNFISFYNSQQKITFSTQTHPDHLKTRDLKGKGCFSIKNSMAEFFKSDIGLCYNLQIIKSI